MLKMYSKNVIFRVVKYLYNEKFDKCNFIL